MLVPTNSGERDMQARYMLVYEVLAMMREE